MPHVTTFLIPFTCKIPLILIPDFSENSARSCKDYYYATIIKGSTGCISSIIQGQCNRKGKFFWDHHIKLPWEHPTNTNTMLYKFLFPLEALQANTCTGHLPAKNGKTHWLQSLF